MEGEGVGREELTERENNREKGERGKQREKLTKREGEGVTD